IAVLSTYVLLYIPTQNQAVLLSVVLIYVFGPFSAMFVLNLRYRERLWSGALSATSKAYVLLFPRDEAFRILRECVSVRASPGKFARMILGDRLMPRFRTFTSLYGSKLPAKESPARLILILLFRLPFTKPTGIIDSPLVAAFATIALLGILLSSIWAIDLLGFDPSDQSASAWTKLAFVLSIV